MCSITTPHVWGYSHPQIYEMNITCMMTIFLISYDMYCVRLEVLSYLSWSYFTHWWAQTKTLTLSMSLKSFISVITWINYTSLIVTIASKQHIIPCTYRPLCLHIDFCFLHFPSLNNPICCQLMAFLLIFSSLFVRLSYHVLSLTYILQSWCLKIDDTLLSEKNIWKYPCRLYYLHLAVPYFRFICLLPELI